MSMFPRQYCKKHGREYRGYMCPECIQEMRNKDSHRSSGKLKNTDIEKIEKVVLLECPNCQEQSLFYDEGTNEYECLNLHCRIKGKSIEDIKAKSEFLQTKLSFSVDPSENEEKKVSNTLAEHAEADSEPELIQDIPGVSINKITSERKSLPKKHKEKYKDKKTRTSSINPIPYRLLPLFLIFALSIIGVSLGFLLGTYIPLWMLLGTGIIYSIERWFYYETRKRVYLGRVYKLILNLILLLVFGHIIWSGVHLFSKQIAQTPLIGSIVFIIEIVVSFWLMRVLNRNRTRWPSMKLTVFSLILLFAIFAFAGVNPFDSYKDSIIDKFSGWYSSLSLNFAVDETAASTTDTVLTSTTFDEEKLISESDDANNGFTLPLFTSDGEYKNYYFGLVKTPDGVLNGNDCFGEFIVLINNQDAKDPTYSELLSFLESDKTDNFLYRYTLSALGFYYGEAEDRIDIDRIKDIIDGALTPDEPRVCADFAERLHNNAELAGIRCGYVSLDMVGYTDPNNLGIASDSGHACNVFETIDKGIIYIDCTGDSDGYGPSSYDRIVDIKIGEDYNPQFLFPSGGWYVPSGQMGKVIDMFVTWDGEWR